jgi:hypothetical protein
MSENVAGWQSQLWTLGGAAGLHRRVLRTLDSTVISIELREHAGLHPRALPLLVQLGLAAK